jgi:hypothetical protein
MNRKRLTLLSGAALVALLLVGLIGATAVFAQEPTPEPQAPLGQHRGGGRGGFGLGLFGLGHGDQWTMFDTAAEALGLTPEELFTELHAGKSPSEVAEAQGVDIEVLQEALQAARTEAMRQRIEQAVEDGNMSRAQADWLLEGLEKGFAPMGRGFRGPGRGGNFSTDAEDA